MIVTTDAEGWARIRLRDFPNATFELEEQERYDDEELEPDERLVTYSLTLLFPDTPDKLLTNLMTVYERLDFAGLRSLLTADHVTLLQTATQAQFPTLGDRLELAEELRCHERLFGRRDVFDSLGTRIPAIEAIMFQTFARQADWAPSEAWDPIPNTTCAVYDVGVLWDRGEGRSLLTTQGQIRFYVTARDSLVNGVTKPYYRLRGQMDLTQVTKAAALEPAAWGAVKAMFR